MRNLAFILFVFFAINANAQYNHEVKSANELLGGEYRKALTVSVYETSVDEVERALKSELKKFGGKMTVKKEIFIDDALVDKMGSNTFDVYARIDGEKNGNTVKIYIAIDLGGAFLEASKHPEQYQYISSWLNQFAVATTKAALDEKVKEAEKQFKSLSKEMEKLQSDKNDLEKAIVDYNEKIKKAENDIQKNSKEQESKKEEIATKEKEVQALKNKATSVK